ncbi:MAG TPA: hypothetical protein ENF73_01190 [Proteobacteria bacterium]|nr:hypothetical protein [Pseudomonadota bacterium]
MSRTVILNGEPVELDLNAESISDFIKGLYASGLLNGEVLRSIRSNGEELLIKEHIADQPLPNGTIELESAPAQKVIVEVLNDARELGEELVVELMNVVEAIRVHGPAEASEPLKRSAELLLTLTGLFSSIDEFLDRWKLTQLGVGFTSFRMRLVDILADLLKAQEAQDWVAVADLIEYELDPALSDLHDRINDTVSKIKGSIR